MNINNKCMQKNIHFGNQVKHITEKPGLLYCCKFCIINNTHRSNYKTNTTILNDLPIVKELPKVIHLPIVKELPKVTELPIVIQLPKITHLPIVKEINEISNLPTLTEFNKDLYPEWHTYYEKVYGHSVINTIDLNTFTWFYWYSPLGNIQTLKLPDTSVYVGLHYPFIFTMYPENIHVQTQYSKLGFFVKRILNDSIFEQSIVEVLRSCNTMFPEVGVAWFFLTIGSGFQLVTENIKVIKNRKELYFPTIITKYMDFDTNPIPKMVEHNTNLLVFTKSEWFTNQGLIEMIYRLDNPDMLGNDANIPMRHGSVNKNNIYKQIYSKDTHFLILPS